MQNTINKLRYEKVICLYRIPDFQLVSEKSGFESSRFYELREVNAPQAVKQELLRVRQEITANKLSYVVG